MSTGLTWVVMTYLNPSRIENSFVFNDYNEARSFADWYLRCTEDSIGSPLPWIFIYTTSPNPSGYCELNSFTPFD